MNIIKYQVMYKNVTVEAVLETKENDDKRYVLNGSKRFYSQQETRLIEGCSMQPIVSSSINAASSICSYFAVSNAKVV